MPSEELQTAFNWELVRASGQHLEGDFAGALQTLENFWEKHHTEDHDGWLRSAVTFQQADIIKDSGDLTGALKAYRSVNVRPNDRLLYLLTAHQIAQILDELGEPLEGLNDLTQRLSEARGAPDKSDLFIVTLYADLAVRLGKDLPSRHREIIRDAVRAWEVPLTDSDAEDAEKLLPALAAANEKQREFAANERRRSSKRA